LFIATLWWTWRNRNMMCLGGENWSLHYVVSNIHNMADTIASTFHTETSLMPIG
jgi:hypothetical protein